MWRKTVVQPERHEEGLADHMNMRESTPFRHHVWIVRKARRDSPPPGRPERPPQAEGLPHKEREMGSLMQDLRPTDW